MNHMTPIQGITIVYADDVSGDEKITQAMGLGCNFITTENEFHTVPQSKKIQWCKDMWTEILKTRYYCCVLTNNYDFIRLLELIVPKNMFQIYHMDTGDTVSNFAELKPNPTLEVGEYLYRETIKEALK